MIIPSIDLMEGRAVQLRQGRTLEIDAGDPRPIAERFGVVGEVAVIDLDAALGRGTNEDVIRELLRIAPCRVGGGIRTAGRALEWLDAGARKVILGTAATPEVLGPLPRERTIAALDSRDGDVVVEGWTHRTGWGVVERMRELRELVGGFLVTFVEVEGTLAGFPLPEARGIVAEAGEARVTFAGGIRAPEEIAALDRLGADAQVGMALYGGRIDLGDAVAAPLVSDRPDGLWPTVVEDTSGRSLGLAWSDAESLCLAIRERRGVYRSRSRGLWRKGETSGATQELLRVRVDCDRDALLFTVRQSGRGFCHTGTTSCFESHGGLETGSALPALETRVRERLADPPAGSLTGRLAGDPELLAGKLVEEAGELAAAESADGAIREMADVLYFALARLVLAGGSLEDVDAELARRRLKVRRRPPREPAAPPDARSRAGTSARSRAAGAGLLPILTPAEATARTRRSHSDPATDRTVAAIVDDVRARGEPAVRAHAERLGDLAPGASLTVSRDELAAALDTIDGSDRAVLERTARRIERFSAAQLETAGELDVSVPGGRAGHRLVPVRTAGCYVPGGRFPLPSSALMTAIPARVAGVETVWIASPRPTREVLAAAAVAGADGVLAVGGAQAIAGLARGAGGAPPCDVIVGPGNRFVTAAKRRLYGEVGIDMLAGPSELLVVAGGEADPDLVAADLIAQAEHDPDAVPLLCVSDEALAAAVRDALERRLEGLDTADAARAALAGGGTVITASGGEILALVEALRPEHLQLVGRKAERLANRVADYGSLFIGAGTSEVFGDYGVGPNHTLPTGGGAGHASGLSVFTFLRRPTWLRMDPGSREYTSAARDCERLARMEGLEGHAKAVEARVVERWPLRERSRRA